MKREIKWELAGGKEAVYTVELQLLRKINLDGDVCEVECCEINGVVHVPGMGFIPPSISRLPEVKLIRGKAIVATIGNTIGVTEEIYHKIMDAIHEAETSPEWIAKQARIKRAEAAEDRDIAAKKRNGFCFRCHSYCYGDCQS